MDHLETGKAGENAAVAFIKKKGYEILERNYRSSYAEVDIIAKHDNQLIFIEVKTRAYTFYGNPEEFVTKKKQENMTFVASMYTNDINYEDEIRFDIIAVIMQEGVVNKINHIEDAFFPGL